MEVQRVHILHKYATTTYPMVQAKEVTSRHQDSLILLQTLNYSSVTPLGLRFLRRNTAFLILFTHFLQYSLQEVKKVIAANLIVKCLNKQKKITLFELKY